MQNACELVGVADKSPALAVLLFFWIYHIEVGGLHRGVPGVERSARDERVVQGVAYKKSEYYKAD